MFVYFIFFFILIDDEGFGPFQRVQKLYKFNAIFSFPYFIFLSLYKATYYST